MSQYSIPVGSSYYENGYNPSTSAEDSDISPLIDNTMKNQIGVSSVTLVSQERSKASRFPQYLAALIVTVGGFCAGTILGWTSPAELRLEAKQEYGFIITTDSFSWISSVMAIGAIIASPVVGWLVDFCGRKMTILLLCVPGIVGWALVIWAESVLMFCIGRFILGMAAGGWCVAVPLYTSEMSEVDIRGVLGTYFQLQISCGIVFVYIVGTFLSVFWLSVTCAAVVIVFTASLIFMPESPTYYLKKDMIEKSRKSLQWFRGEHYDISAEIQELQRNIDEISRNSIPLVEAFSSVPAKRGLVLGLGLMLYQQLSGVNGVIFYTTKIFEEAGSSLDSSTQTIIVGSVMAIATYVASLGIDRFGRRPLLLFSVLMMGVSTFFLGLYFYFSMKGDVSAFSWVPITSLCSFLIAFALGFGPIPWMYCSEIYSKQIAGYACSIACLFNWLCVFLVTRFFPPMKAWIGFAGTFWVFTFISVTGVVFVYFLVPETKGRTIEEMQIQLGGRPTPNVEEGEKPRKF